SPVCARRAAAGGGRGGRRLRLGALARSRRRLRRHDRVRRVRTLRRSLQAFRDYGRSCGRSCSSTDLSETEEAMAVRVAINGFGRIGRLVLRAIHESKRDDVEVVAVNDLGPVETNAHLLRYDSVHGPFPGEVKTTKNGIDIGRGEIRVVAERDPAKLPWK